MRRLARKNGTRVRARIEPIPIAGVVLALLTIFLVNPIGYIGHGVTISLPQAGSPVPMSDAAREDALIVAVMRDGKVFFGTQQVAPEDLADKVKARMATRPEQRLFIKADARVLYRSVTEVVDSLQVAGITQMGLLTERRTGADPLL